MAARIPLAVLLLTACGASPPAPDQPPSFSRNWQAHAQAGARLEDCLIKISLPNPQYPADYQELVRRVWASRTARNIPVFFTYSRDRYLFVIFNAECSRRGAFAGELEAYIHSGNRLQSYQVEAVQPAEARSIIAYMDDMAAGGS
jgi:hypothetical protein